MYESVESSDSFEDGQTQFKTNYTRMIEKNESRRMKSFLRNQGGFALL